MMLSRKTERAFGYSCWLSRTRQSLHHYEVLVEKDVALMKESVRQERTRYVLRDQRPLVHEGPALVVFEERRTSRRIRRILGTQTLFVNRLVSSK